MSNQIKSSSRFSLKTRLVAMTLGLTVLLGAGSFIAMKRVTDASRNDDMESFGGLAQALVQSITAQYYERYGDVQAFSINPSIRSKDKKTIIEALNTYVALYGIYDLIMITDTRGRLVAVNTKNPDGGDISSEKLYQKNYASAPWFKAVIEGRFTEDKEDGMVNTYAESIGEDPNLSAVYGERRLGSGFSTFVKDDAGKVIGVITNRASSKWFEVAFKDAASSLIDRGLTSGELTLLDTEGHLLYQRGVESFRKKQPYDWTLISALIQGATVEQIKEKKRGVRLESGPHGPDEKISGYAYVSGGKFTESLNWGVIVSADAEQVFNSEESARRLFLSMFAMTMLLSVGLSIWFSTYLSKRLTSITQDLAKGGAEVASAAALIAGSSGTLSEAAGSQAAALQQTAASIDEVSAMVKKNSENAQQSKENSGRSRESAEQGKAAVERMILSIGEISDSNDRIMNQVTEGNRRISEIVQVISEIGNKTKVINDIVFQTKLLSFNASVEAARAGEHGKGFAVVAEEVGNLAEMSGNAAKEISQMLAGSLSKVESIVTETKSSVEKLVVESKTKVEGGKATARECEESLNRILEGVTDLDTMVAEISTASREQSQGVDEINKAMNQLDQSTQQNAAVAEKSAQASDQLSVQAARLAEVVSELNLLVVGEAANTPSRSSSPSAGERGGSPADGRRNVVPMKRKSKELHAKAAAPVAAKKEATTGQAIPSHSDPRFEDI